MAFMASSFRWSRSSFAVLSSCTIALAACSSSSSGSTGPTTDGDAGPVFHDDAHVDARPDVVVVTQPEASAPEASAPVDAGHVTEAAPPLDAGVSAPRNASCTPTKQQLGTLTDSPHGRMDGTLVYVVNVGEDKQCNGDDSHVHLQVEVSGNVYDVAVDIGTAPNDEVGMYQTTIALPDGAWSEGWHDSDDLSYPSLGLSSTSFTTMDPDHMAAQVEALLASTTQISIFCKGYTPQGNGCHDVHYEDGSGGDGALVLNPTAATSPVLFFRFTTQSF
jgi:hypothetical protein